MSGEWGERSDEPDAVLDEPFGYISNEHPYQRILRWCGPFVASARRSVETSSPYGTLSWATGFAGVLEFGTRFRFLEYSNDPWFLGASLVSEVPILLVIALALARPRHPIAVRIVRIITTVLLALAVVVVLWAVVRFVIHPDSFGDRLLFPLSMLNLIAIPLALWVLAFRR